MSLKDSGSLDDKWVAISSQWHFLTLHMHKRHPAAAPAATLCCGFTQNYKDKLDYMLYGGPFDSYHIFAYAKVGFGLRWLLVTKERFAIVFRMSGQRITNDDFACQRVEQGGTFKLF